MDSPVTKKTERESMLVCYANFYDLKLL